MGSDKLAGAACRAIRLEAGWAAEMVEILRASPDASSTDVEVATRRLTAIDAIKSQRQCRGKRVTYSASDQTIRELARIHEIPWLVGLWRSSSQVIHGGGWDWSLATHPDGSLITVDLSPSWRAVSLNHLVIGFHNVAQTYVSIVGLGGETAAVKAVYDAGQEVLADPWLIRMIDGDFD